MYIFHYAIFYLVFSKESPQRVGLMNHRRDGVLRSLKDITMGVITVFKPRCKKKLMIFVKSTLWK